MTRTSWLALVAECGPILLFFVTGQLTDFFTAVTLFVASTTLAVLVSWHLDRRIPWLPIASALFVIVGGLITVIYREPDAIIFADTLYYLTIVFIIAAGLSRRVYILERLFRSVFALTPEGWRRLTWRWLLFLLLAAIANEFARHLLTPEAWVDYRFYKTIVVVCFAFWQFTLAHRYRIPEESNTWGLRTAPPTPRE